MNIQKCHHWSKNQVLRNTALIHSSQVKQKSSKQKIKLNTLAFIFSAIWGSQSVVAQTCDWGAVSGLPYIFTCQSGVFNSNAIGTENNEQFQITGGKVEGDLFGGDGDDSFVLREGQVNAISGDNGNDYMELHGGFHTELSSFKIDGGLDYDNLTIKNFNGTLNADKLLNLETISLQDSTILKLTGYQLQFSPSSDWGNYLVVGRNSELQFNSNFFTIIGADINNSGTLNLRGLEPGKTLFLNGNYVGEAGSKILFNTKLESDSSPTDYLVVSGYAIGQSKIYVQNKGGLGAKTINGIRIIEIQGASIAKFTLGSPVQISNYEYFLIKKGNDWYLESSTNGNVNCLDCDSNDGSADKKETDTTTKIVAAPKNNTQPQIYRPAIAGYLLTASSQIENNTNFLVPNKRAYNNSNKTNEIWGVVQSNQAKLYSTTLAYQQNGQIIQFGKDIFNTGDNTNPNPTTEKFGITVGIGQLSTDYFDKSRSHTNTGEFSGVSQSTASALGAYYQYANSHQGYIDLQSQLISRTTQFTDIYEGKAQQKSLGMVLSAELGKAIAVNTFNTDFEISPQAQFIYQTNINNAFTDDFSEVEKQTVQSLRARAGISIKSNLFKNASLNKRVSNSYWNASLNLWQEVLNNPNRSISNNVLITETAKKPWLELGIGLHHSLTDTSNLAAQINFKQSISGKQQSGKSVNIAYELKW
jgi:outer membrane autotransporter protein